MQRFRPTAVIAASALAAALAVVPVPVQAAPASGPSVRVTNLAHLDFLLDAVRLPAVTGHSTRGSAAVELPWTYADRLSDGSFRRIGGGDLDPATGTWTQGAFNSDDVARTAVVYTRDWRQTGSASSRAHAEAVLRGLAYFQTTTGAHAGDVVLWMQPDGALNPSAKPVELPDPSDSGPSFWLARTVWAYGEGYAAFRRTDPGFAAFLRDRMRLAVRALDREVLDAYGRTAVADGVRVPAWLIGDGADESAEAVLGLAAFVRAAPGEAAARRALAELAEGVRRLGATTTSDPSVWPYGAILPSATSRTSWHPWASQTAASLAAAAGVLHDRRLLGPAVVDSARFGPALLAAGGPVNLLGPTPSDRTQIAYGIDSRVEDLLATADATGASGLRRLAALQAAWFFGANPSGTPAYDPATGVTVDGVQGDGTVNRNSGAESTIHGLLTMLALDAHPAVRAEARILTGLGARSGLGVVEAESGSTDGTVFTPVPASSAESAWSGQGLRLTAGETATFAVPGSGPRAVEAVVLSRERRDGTAPVSRWSTGGRSVTVVSVVGAQGITPLPGALRAQAVGTVRGSAITVTAVRGTVELDALLVRPLVQTVVLGSGGARTTLAVDASGGARPVQLPAGSTAQRYRADGSSAGAVRVPASGVVRIPSAGFVVARG